MRGDLFGELAHGVTEVEKPMAEHLQIGEAGSGAVWLGSCPESLEPGTLVVGDTDGGAHSLRHKRLLEPSPEPQDKRPPSPHVSPTRAVSVTLWDRQRESQFLPSTFFFLSGVPAG